MIWSWTILCAMNISSHKLSTSISLFTEHPLSIMACPCVKSNSWLTTHHKSDNSGLSICFLSNESNLRPASKGSNCVNVSLFGRMACTKTSENCWRMPSHLFLSWFTAMIQGSMHDMLHTMLYFDGAFCMTRTTISGIKPWHSIHKTCASLSLSVRFDFEDRWWSLNLASAVILMSILAVFFIRAVLDKLTPEPVPFTMSHFMNQWNRCLIMWCRSEARSGNIGLTVWYWTRNGIIT